MLPAKRERINLAELVQHELIDALIRALDHAPHGGQTALVERAAREQGVSKQTIYNRLRARGWSSERKLRSDRNDSDCSMEELLQIAAIQQARPRQNGKIICTATDAIDVARANGMLKTTLSNASIVRLLRLHRLDSQTLNQPTPHTATQSRHPNHVWQGDASICVLYYLKNKEGALQVMREEKFNQRKPDQLAKVLDKRVMRYACSDHTSGAVFAKYFMTAGENQRTLFEFLMAAMQKQEGRVMHGVPWIFELDKASANTSHAIKNLFSQLGTRLIAHQPGNPRANGQVEQSHNMIETQFEFRLAYKRIETVEELNADLDLYLADLNSARIHSRHGMTRSACWQMIREDELRICPPVPRCQQLMMSQPEERQVSGDLCIAFNNLFYPVDHVPGVRVGDRVQVSVNPYAEPEVFVRVEREGQALYISSKPRLTNKFGFFVDAPMRGESYAPHADTAADLDRKALMDRAWGTRDRLARDQAMSKGPAFGGAIDPMADLRAAKADHPSFMTRPGTEITLAPTVPEEAQSLTFHALLRAIVNDLGRSITPEENTYLRSLNQTFTSADVVSLAEQLRRPQPTERPRLVAVK